MRHAIRKDVAELGKILLANRAAETDVGLSISQGSVLDTKNCIGGLAKANFKRAQEAMRSVEEGLKLVGYYELSKKI